MQESECIYNADDENATSEMVSQQKRLVKHEKMRKNRGQKGKNKKGVA